VDRVAVGVDGGAADRAVVIVHVVRLHHRLRAALHRLVEREVGVLDLQRDVVNAVAMFSDVLRRLVTRVQRRGDDESNLSLRQDIRRHIAIPRLQSAVPELREAERLPIEIRRLLRVACPELHVMDALQPQRVLTALWSARRGIAFDGYGHRVLPGHNFRISFVMSC
jgi:hypothetical protein